MSIKSVLLVIGLGVAMISPVASVASPIEHEVDVASASYPVGITYGDHTVGASLGTSLEVDRYTFEGTAGDRVRLVLAGRTTQLDPFISLRAPGGTVINSAFCNTSHTCSTSLNQVLPTSGLYTINVSDQFSSNAGQYELHIDQNPARDWVPYAASPVSGSLGHQTDLDYYAFLGNAGTGVRVAVASQTKGLDLRLEVWDPSGNKLTDVPCATSFTCIIPVDYDLSATGLYKLVVSNYLWHETGNYLLSLSCNYGACPGSSFQIPAVPEPSSQLLMLLGLVVVGSMARARWA